MSTPHKHAPVIKAWADGAVIQYKNGFGEWVDVDDNRPAWGNNAEYRIKPEPHKHQAFIDAWERGEAVQFRRETDHEWFDLVPKGDPINQPGWFEGLMYRIKPRIKQYPMYSIVPLTEGGNKEIKELLEDTYNFRKVYETGAIYE
jgi:hypothetical protein